MDLEKKGWTYWGTRRMGTLEVTVWCHRKYGHMSTWEAMRLEKMIEAGL